MTTINRSRTPGNAHSPRRIPIPALRALLSSAAICVAAMVPAAHAQDYRPLTGPAAGSGIAAAPT